MKYEKTIKISEINLNEENSLLQECSSESGRYVLCTVYFPNGFFAEIEIKKAEKLWIRGVLFDLLGYQVEYSENNKDNILGEYYFDDGINEYIVSLEIEDTPNPL